MGASGAGAAGAQAAAKDNTSAKITPTAINRARFTCYLLLDF